MNKIIKEDLGLISNSDLDWGKFKNKVVLVSGAYGMLASYMVFTLLYLNHVDPKLNIKVIALGRNLDKAKARFIEFLKDPNFSIMSADVVKDIKIKGDVDYIIHAASPASSQFYGVNPIGVISPNIFGTKNLLELAREKGSEGFLLFSSGEVCGLLDKDAIEESDAGYSDPTDLRNCYGESKRMAENMCQCWYRQHKVPTLIVRPDHTYGPTMDLENDHRVFAEFVSDVVNGRNISMKSDGTPVRTFCYLSDATEGFFRVLLKGVPGESYNVSNNNCRISIGDLAALVASLSPGKDIKVIYSNRDDKNYLENKHKIRPMLSTKKIEKLGFKCRFGVRDGFYRTIQSFLIKES